MKLTKKAVLSAILALTFAFSSVPALAASEERDQQESIVKININNEDDFVKFLKDSEGLEYSEVRLKADIDLSKVNIPKNAVLNISTFEGEGHSISNQSETLFEKIYRSSFLNVNFKNISTHNGAVAKYANQSYFSGLTVTGHTKGNNRIGSIVGSMDHSTNLSCTNYSTVEDYYDGDPYYQSDIGGMVGQVVGCCTIISCDNYGEVRSFNRNVGGIIGSIESNAIPSEGPSFIEHCANHGNVTTRLARPLTGGIIGRFNACAENLSMDSCINTGIIHNNHSDGGGHGYVSGLVGYIAYNSCGYSNKIRCCANLARVSSDNGDKTDAICLMGYYKIKMWLDTNYYISGKNTASSISDTANGYKKAKASDLLEALNKYSGRT